jgi:membrane-bound ClpP family serine protease
MDQVVQVFGSVLILIAFVAVQRNRLSPDSVTYLWLNFVGGCILAVLAAIGSQFGFLLLEGVWAIVAGVALWKRRGARPSSA